MGKYASKKVIKQFRFIFISGNNRTIRFFRILTTGRDLKQELTYFQKCLEL